MQHPRTTLALTLVVAYNLAALPFRWGMTFQCRQEDSNPHSPD